MAKYHDCQHCGTSSPVCERCGESLYRYPGNGNPVPAPYGSVDTRHPLMLCGKCHHELIILVYQWAGRPWTGVLPVPVPNPAVPTLVKG